MNRNVPLISVTMPVFNGEEHLSECIESVLSQTYSDFEFIIVDDASTDTTAQILEEFEAKDKRIKIITHKVNQKQTVAANTACKHAKGKYIARMDADDIALPNRFMKQITFLEENNQIGLLGSWVDIIDNNGNFLKMWRTNPTNQFLNWNLLFGSSFAHSSVMMKRECLEQVGFYKLHQAEDYDLWSRLSRITNIANLPEVLQQKRVWDGQLALRVVQNNHDCTLQIMQNNMNYLLVGKHLDLQMVTNIRKVSDKNPAITNSHLISETKNSLMQLYINFVSKFELTMNEKKMVSRDIFKKLSTLANWQYSVSITKGLIEKFYLAYNFPKLVIYSLIQRK